jgi:hypothetical protein
MLKDHRTDFESVETMNTILESPTPSVNDRSCPEDPLEQELEFLWQDRDQAGRAYDLYLGRISRNPVVRSHATGKHFMLPWSEIIELAAEHGVDAK